MCPVEGGRARLDELLVARDLFASRSRARDAVLRGTVRVDGAAETRPGRLVARGATIAVDDPASRYVSRAALKLAHGLDYFGIDVTGRLVLDIGASTGGFSQILLERGAAHVTAIDVGHGQMDSKLASDPRVAMVEGLNARDLTPTRLDHGAPDIVVADVSFISLKLALPPALALAAPGARAILLVKPQFEVGRQRIGKGGLLRDSEDGPRIAGELGRWLDAVPGWHSIGLTPSPVIGGDGNREFLLAGEKAR